MLGRQKQQTSLYHLTGWLRIKYKHTQHCPLCQWQDSDQNPSLNELLEKDFFNIIMQTQCFYHHSQEIYDILF